MESLSPSFTTPRMRECLAFYRDLLGFACTGTMEHEGTVQWAELTNGPVTLMLLAAEEAHDGEDAPRFDGAGVIFYFRGADVRGVRDSLAGMGARLSPLEVTFYGMRECYVQDPDGRQLTLAAPSEEDDVVTVTGL